MRSSQRLLAAIAALPLLSAAAVAAADVKQDDAGPAIVKGEVVSLEYTLADDKGAQIESNKGRDPLVYTQGQGQIIPGLEKALVGLHKGQEKDVKVPPEEGYGAVDKGAFQEIPKEKIPAEARKPGTILRAQSPDGKVMAVRVAEVKDKTVLVDFNHPMAGKTLVFHVKVLDVKPAEKSEAAPAPAVKSTK